MVSNNNSIQGSSTWYSKNKYTWYGSYSKNNSIHGVVHGIVTTIVYMV